MSASLARVRDPGASIFEGLEERIVDAEKAILLRLGVADRLSAIAATPAGLAAFARAFYFCRVEFVRLNFILGARCPDHEKYWGGIVRNLWEEFGGGETKPHNALYRDFLTFATGSDEANLEEPAFAKTFNRSWTDFIQNEPVEKCLFAFAVYEALDVPDYVMLYESMRRAAGERAELAFFKVHTGVRHFDLFEEFFKTAAIDDEVARDATSFVMDAQEKMWRGLLDSLSEHAK